MSNHPASSYQQAAVQGASPVGQVVALYDTILRDFFRATAALKAEKVEARVEALNHALTIIGYLQGVLDHEHGGESAKQFERFYNVTRGLIVEANAKATPESLENLISLYSGLRQAWYQADQRLTLTGAPPEHAPVEPPQKRGAYASNDDAEVLQLHWRV